MLWRCTGTGMSTNCGNSATDTGGKCLESCSTDTTKPEQRNQTGVHSSWHQYTRCRRLQGAFKYPERTWSSFCRGVELSNASESFAQQRYITAEGERMWNSWETYGPATAEAPLQFKQELEASSFLIPVPKHDWNCKTSSASVWKHNYYNICF